MLNVVIGESEIPAEYEVMVDPRYYFKYRKKPEWFEDEFVKRFLKEVDGTEVLFEEALKDKFGHGISTMMMSTGCKTLCVIYYDTNDKVYYNGSAMGDNCIPFLMEMAEKRDINIFLRHDMHFSDNEMGIDFFKTGLIKIYGKPVDNEDDYYDIFDEKRDTVYD